MSALIDTRAGYHGLSDIYTPIAVAVLVLFWILIIAFAVRFRRRRDAPAPPPQIDENPKAEGAYVALLAAVCALLVYFTFSWMGRDVADLPAEPLAAGKSDAQSSSTPRPVQRIRVTASQWNWRFDYPQGITQVGDGSHIPTLVVPVGDVQFTLTSLDVVHSFFIPVLRFKRDAFPRRPTNFTLGFDRIGFHHAAGDCAEFCGLRHSYMQFNVEVLGDGAFRRWVAARRAGRPQQVTPALDQAGRYR